MKKLTDGNIYKTFILFAIPMVLAGLLSQSYNILNTIIAGKFIGEKGLAEIGATSALISLISSIFSGFGVGFSIYIARLYGAGEYNKIKNSIYNNYLLIISASIVICSLMLIFSDNIMSLLNVDLSIRHESLIYFSIYIAGLPIIMLTTNGIFIMNALGISAFPFFMSVISAVLTIGGNLLGVIVLKKGVWFLAVSTIISSLFVVICYFIKLKKCFKSLEVSTEKFIFSFKECKITLGYSVPTMLQQIIMYFSSLAVSPLVNGLGVASISSYAVIMKIYDINAVIYQNSAKTLSNYTAQCVGAGNYNKLKKGVMVGFEQGIFFLLPILLICVFFPNQICSIFYKQNFSGESLNLSVLFTQKYLPFIFFNVINNLFHAFFRGIKAMNFLIASTFIGAFSRIIISFFLVKSYAIQGIYLGWVLSWFIESLFVLFIFFSGKWETDKIKT